MKHIFVLALCALMVAPANAEGNDLRSSRRPVTTGHLSFAAASEGLNVGSGDAPTCLAVEAGLRFENALGPISLIAEGRHFTSDAAYWRDKSAAAFGIDVPLGRDAVLFGRWEKRYRIGDSWTMTGIRFTFGKHDD